MVKTMKGRQIDMHAMAAANANVRAVGNIKMNARGDRLGANNEVVRTAEEIEKDRLSYNRENPNRVRHAPVSALESEVFASPAEVYSKEPRKLSVEPSLTGNVQTVGVPMKTKKVVSDD